MTEFAQIFRVALPGGRVCLLCTNNGKRRLPTGGLVLLGMFDPKQGGLFFPQKGGRGVYPTVVYQVICCYIYHPHAIIKF
jgi:hypothetical protein